MRASLDEVGQAPIVHVVRGNQTYSACEPDARIRPGDKLIVIRSSAGRPEDSAAR
jgi:K+/H+ antiporter YhaU regulatory subunit KhtT